ncbi:hypothetical protein [Haloarcula rubripromontorii]|uniref:hypothetical protein n=1 Tax=Haloarcula rubripromontorii TaxID=1705562 RepID=UPI0012BA9DBC|nr:hypothetical protein [Haloarcula rubripromontorii]
MPSGYTLIPVLQTPSVDPGGTAVIDLYISGTGEVENSKLVMIWGNRELSAEHPGSLKIGYDVSETEDGGAEVNFVEEGELPDGNEHDIDEIGAVVKLPSWMFTTVPQNFTESHDVFDNNIMSEGPESYEQVLTEVGAHYPPFRLEMNISGDAKPGDYTITSVLAYNSGVMNQPYYDRRESELHVNNRRERWEPVPTLIAIGGGTAAVLSLISQTGFFNWLYCFLVSIF